MGNIFDFLSPPKDEELLVRKINESEVSGLLQSGTHQNTVFLASYRNPMVRALVVAAKFQRNKKAQVLLARLLDQWLKKNPMYLKSKVAWVPIPLSKKRQRDRGYNQTEQILRQSNSVPPNCIYLDLLIRTQDTPPQSSLPKTERANNVRGVFKIQPDAAHKLQGIDVILFDDVITTGATLKAARAKLAPLSPSSITCLAIAG